MTTNRINNGSPTTPQLTNPLLQPAQPKTDAEKAKAAQMAAATGAVISAPAAEGGSVGDGQKPNYNVQISGDAKSRAEAHAKALSIARATPDIREDRVAALKKQIDEGTYKVDAGNIADGMLHEAVRDHLANNPDR